MNIRESRDRFVVIYVVLTVCIGCLFWYSQDNFLLISLLVIVALLPVALLWGVNFPEKLETPQMIIFGFVALSAVSLLEIFCFSLFYKKEEGISNVAAFYLSAQYYFSTGNVIGRPPMTFGYVATSVAETLLGYIYAIAYLSSIMYGLSSSNAGKRRDSRLDD